MSDNKLLKYLQYYYYYFLAPYSEQDIDDMNSRYNSHFSNIPVEKFIKEFILDARNKANKSYNKDKIIKLIDERTDGLILSTNQLRWYLDKTLPTYKIHETIIKDFPRNRISYGNKDYENIVSSYLIDLGFKPDEDFKFVKNEFKGWKISVIIETHNVVLCINSLYDSATNFGSSDPNYVHRRTLKLSDDGYRVINLFEEHILDLHKWTVLKDIIAHACNKTKYKLYARDCEIKVVPSKDMTGFFNENNIQLSRGAKTAFVLVLKKDKFGLKAGEPIMSYTVGKAFFGKGAYDAEIARGACRLGYSVTGGATKIWAYIKEYYKDKDLNNNPGSVNSIIYYTDLNYYSGQSVRLLPGNKLIRKSPGFWNYWTKEQKMKNREPMRHKDIKRLGESFLKDFNGNNFDEILNGDYLFVINNAGTLAFLWERDAE